MAIIMANLRLLPPQQTTCVLCPEGNPVLSSAPYLLSIKVKHRVMIFKAISYHHRTGFQALCVLTPSLMSSKLSFGVTAFCPAVASTPKCWLRFCHHVGLSHPLQTPGHPPLWLQPFFFTSVRSQLPGSGSMACRELWGRWSRRQGGPGCCRNTMR